LTDDGGGISGADPGLKSLGWRGARTGRLFDSPDIRVVRPKYR
jgi:hypothetical protein